MMTTTTNIEQQVSRTRVSRALGVAVDLMRRAGEWAYDLKAKAQAKVNWEAGRPDVAAGSMQEYAWALLYPLIGLAVLGGDLLLGRPTAEWLARKYVGHPTSVAFLSWAMPTAIFAIEVAVGVMLARDQQAVDRGDVRPRTTRLLAGGLVCVMGGLTLATQISLAPAAGTDATMHTVRSVAVTAAAVVLHSFTLLSGRMVLESLGLYLYLIGRAWHGATTRLATRAGRALERKTLAAVAQYRQLKATHLATWPDDRHLLSINEALLSAQDSADPHSGSHPPSPSPAGVRSPSAVLPVVWHTNR